MMNIAQRDHPGFCFVLFCVVSRFRYFNNTTLRVDLKLETSTPPQAV